jgi:hypothetical protein
MKRGEVLVKSQSIEDEPQARTPAARGKNDCRRKSEEAAAFLRKHGATYVRGVYHKRPGWWSVDNIFLGARSIEARAEFERLSSDDESAISL